MRSWRTCTIIALLLFISLNVYYWRSLLCTDPRFCNLENLSKEDPSYPEQPLEEHPTPPPPIQNTPEIPQPVPIPEAHLTPHFTIDSQPPSKPETHYPDTEDKFRQDLDTIAPTADKTTYRLTEQGLKYATQGDLWQFGIINTKPDVLVVTNTNYQDLSNHYQREFRIYTLMKWILRVHRRDPERHTPLVMVDAGSNHGLFSLVAGASGAHTIAFEPQTHLRSKEEREKETHSY
ncbi:hypothetical protein BD560DRAFT_482414 [Blakeslea trispora]|nr:hypothetical protein BD560DRAFT_482414 [Blakeslea trispora]